MTTLTPTRLDYATALADMEAERRRRTRPSPAPLSLFEWSLTHRRIAGGAFTITPALEAIYTTTHKRVVLRKAAQVFVSEYLINAALWVPDTRQGGRGNSLYLFPRKEQLLDFSHARVDTAIEQSVHLTARVGGNVKLKRVGDGYLYLRGAQNRAGIISVDADCVLCDEIAEYTPGTIDTIERRLGSSLLDWIRAGSTPRYPADEAGVLWDQSTQQVYQVKCSRCGTWQHLDILTHLDPRTGAVSCTHCRGDMGQDRLSVGHWEAQQPGKPWEGYQLNKLLSPRANLGSVADKYLTVLEGRATPSETQEFYNSDAGIPYLPEGGHLSPAALDACREHEYRMPDTATGAVMGIDVGARHHVVILVREGERLRLVHVEAVRSFEELDPLMRKYGVRRAVIDANPERTKAREFADRWRGRVFLAYYPNFADGQRGDLCVWNKDKGEVRINRTVALDGVLNRVEQQKLILPEMARALGGAIDKAGVGEFYRHLGAPIRVISTNAQGNAVARYEQNGADHYAHSLVYASIAADGALVTGPAVVSGGDRAAIKPFAPRGQTPKPMMPPTLRTRR